MAWNVFNWAKAQKLPPTQKLVLLLLADHAHKDGSESRPGYAVLMRESGLSRGAIYNALQGLKRREMIQVLAYPKGGHGCSTVWRCCLENASPPAPLNASPPAPLNASPPAPLNGKNASPGAMNASPGAMNASPGEPQPQNPKNLKPSELRSLKTLKTKALSRAQISGFNERELEDELRNDIRHKDLPCRDWFLSAALEEFRAAKQKVAPA